MAVDTFIKKRKLLIVYTFLLGFVTYGIKIFSFNNGMDTLNYVESFDSYLMHWLMIGRPAMYFFKKYILGMYMNFFLANFFFVVFLCFTSIGICFIADNKVSSREWQKLFIIPSLFVTSPLFIQQAYFSLQEFEFSLSMFLITMCAICVSQGLNKRLPYRLLSICLLFIAFSCYQSFPIFYVGLILFIVMLDIYDDYLVDKKLIILSYIKYYIHPLIDMVIAFCCYLILNRIMLSHFNLKASSYLSGQIKWGREPLTLTVKNIIIIIKNNLLSTFSFSFNCGMIIGLVGLILVFLAMIIKRKKFKVGFFFLLLVVLLYADAFLFVLLLGSIPALRAYVPSYCLVASVSIYIFSLFINNRHLKQLLSLFIIVLLGKQLIASSNLLQADQIRYDQDMALIGRIESQLDRLSINPERSKLMIVGYHNNETPLNIQEELVGESMFQFGDFTGNTSAMTYNIVSLMNQNGYNINAVSNDQFKKEFGQSKSMRVFPEKNSIKVKGNLVIVKLS